MNSFDGRERRKEDVYLKKIEERLAHIEGYLESEFGTHGVRGNLHQNFDDIKADIQIVYKTLKDQNGRIGKLENWRSGVVAVIAGIVIVLGWIVPTIISEFFTRG